MSIPVLDPFGAVHDPKMPFLVRALTPEEALRSLERCCPRLAGEKDRLCLRAIRVTRHKPGRRCLVEYDLEVERADTPPEAITLVGKARARGADDSAYRLLDSLRNAGFGADAEDGISVPEPVGVVPEFHMWLQHKVPGVVASRLLARPEGVALAGRIAEAIHKLHRAGVPSSRRHTMADELRILHERLAVVAQLKPQWGQRLRRLLNACGRLAAATPEPPGRGIHRDFYPDQVLVNGPRLYLLDLDLYCEGDPGLDVGNFLGHVTEQSLRTLGRPDALADREEALAERFLQFAGAAACASVQAYTTLTLVRHVYLSTQFPERHHLTEPLLEWCERRLSAAEPVRSGGAAHSVAN